MLSESTFPLSSAFSTPRAPLDLAFKQSRQNLAFRDWQWIAVRYLTMPFMGRPTAASKKGSTAPPVSLTTCWDKGKWHFEAPSFPAHLPRSAGWTHIVATLRFLEERGQLTAAGRDELAHADEEIVLISDQVKAGARAFLDQNYQAYLRAIERYGFSPPVQVLEAGWDEYTAKYDVSKRPKANAYQQLLLNHSYDRTPDALLRALDRVPDLASQIREALDGVPAGDRPLIVAVLISREADPVGLAGSWPNPGILLHALRTLTRIDMLCRACARP